MKEIIYKIIENNKEYNIKYYNMTLWSIHYKFDGRFHRENGPAIIFKDGYRRWYKYGKTHRDNGPALINSDGTTEYWLNGEWKFLIQSNDDLNNFIIKDIIE